MEILKLNQDNSEIIAKAVEVLSKGGLIIYPTETCYGVGVDATNQEAVKKLMQYKSRREGKPLSIAVSSKDMASKYVELNDISENIYDNYLPGPITVVSKGLHKVADGVESEFGTLGIRLPDYELILKLVEVFGKPITSTSANASYKPRPYNIDTIFNNLSQKQKDLVDLVIDAGELPPNEPSTVVDTTMNNVNVMREGSHQFQQSVESSDLLLHAVTKATEDTMSFGGMVVLKNVDSVIEGPLILALKGEMGAGKTQFVKGIAKYLGIEDEVSSPTYTIIDEYKYELGKHRSGYLVHMDTWRVDGKEEFMRTGLSGYMNKGNVIAIEWADKFFSELQAEVENANGTMLIIEFLTLSELERDIKVYKQKS